MIARTWEYGTVRAVRIEDVVASHKLAAVVCVDVGDPTEGYVVMDGVAAIEAAGAAKGQLRSIEFTRGGPTGGYWKFQPMAGGGA